MGVSEGSGALPVPGPPGMALVADEERVSSRADCADESLSFLVAEALSPSALSPGRAVVVVVEVVVVVAAADELSVAAVWVVACDSGAGCVGDEAAGRVLVLLAGG